MHVGVHTLAAVTVSLAWGTGGCARYFSGASSDGAAVDGAPADVAIADATTRPDAGGPVVDARPLDGGAPVVDAIPQDGGPPVVDAMPQDGGPPVVDAIPLDALQPGGCNQSATIVLDHRVNADMVVCRELGALNDQCAAAKLCGAGWHLCTPAEYQAVFGAAPPPVVGAWIAGCLRDNSALTAPTAGACSSCLNLPLQDPDDVAWDCASYDASFSSGALYLGLQSAWSCNRVGENSPATAAHWQPMSANAGSGRAVCCR